MARADSQFVGSIPENYDRGLGPNIFHDYGEDLSRRAGALGAKSVLELAAGTGIVSRKLRDALAPEARLVVTDLNLPMLEIARAKFQDEDWIEFAEADAMALPFPDSTFDLIVCQFGVMFFPDKLASFREAARVLGPGGHYVFNTWGPMPANPFSEIANDVATRFFPDDPPGFYRVPFSYSDPDVVRVDLQRSGFLDVEHETMRRQKTVRDLEGFARGLVFGNPFIAEIQQRGGVSADDVMSTVLEEFRERMGPEPVSMPLEATAFIARTT